jgi:hypothetical protein
MRRFITAGVLLTAVALAAATGASAAVSPSYQVGGIAFGAAQSTTFYGNGVGSTGDRASWQATTARDPVTGSITGGTFSLRSSNGSTAAWALAGGSYTLASATPGCGRQTYTMVGNLTSADGAVTLTATLTTFRLQFRGTCTTLLSTVTGTLTPAVAGPPVGSGDL